MNRLKTLAFAFAGVLCVFLCGCGSNEASEVPAPETAAPSAVTDTVATPATTPEPTPEPVPALPAKQLNVAFESGDVEAEEALTDDDIYSYLVIDSDVTLEIKANGTGPIDSIYLEWYRRPAAFKLEYPDGSVQIVDENMLHQVVRLDRPSDSLTVSPFGSSYLQLSELKAFSGGILPAEIQDWKKLGEGEADICLFPAHADDEYVFFGGIIPYYAGELGYNVQVCWNVCHDDYYIRNHELLNALWKSGCEYYPEINYGMPDIHCIGLKEALEVYSFSKFETYEVEMIRKYRPFVVVGHDENGEYGHGAHVLSSLALEQAAVDAADPEMFTDSAIRYGAWDVQKTYIHLYGDRDEALILDIDRPLDAFGGKTAYEAALDCYHEHVSQYTRTGYTVYREDSEYDSRIFGLQRTTVGADVRKDDLLENIDFSMEKAGVFYEPTQSEINASKMASELLPADMFAECAQNGTVETGKYTSTDVLTGNPIEKRILVYLPYGYDEGKQYNVLVLSQGAGLDENAWFADNTDEAGRRVSLATLLDNMICRELCEPLIVASVSWENSESCSFRKYNNDDLQVTAAQQTYEMKNSVLPYIIQNYSTFAEGYDGNSIGEARDHFAFAGMSWSGMAGVPGLAGDAPECFAWLAAFAPSHFKIFDTPGAIDAAFDEYPLRCLLFCTGSKDADLTGGKGVFNEIVSGSEYLREGYNARFVEVYGGEHGFGTYLTGVYNALCVFFAPED